MQFSNPDYNVRELGLKPGEKVAIFGSGSGGHTLAAARALGGSGIILAIDERGNMVEKLKKEVGDRHHLNVRVISGNVDKIGGTGTQSGTTDDVIIPDTLFARRNKKAVLLEADRILKPGGRIMIIDWKASYKGAGPQSEHVFTEDEARKLAEDCGFVFNRKFSAGNYHYALIFHKKEPKKR